METKSTRASNTIITRNTNDFSRMTDNDYETVAVLSRRANQLAAEEKKELNKNIEEFTVVDTGEEVYENRERIEMVRHYEQMPKPTLVATQEYLNDEIYYRNPSKETTEQERKIEAIENEAIASKK